MWLRYIWKAFGRYPSVVVFVLILASSAVTGMGSYRAAEAGIVADMNRALAVTLAGDGGMRLVRDTVRVARSLQCASPGGVVVRVADRTFRRNISTAGIRDTAFVALMVASGDSDAARGGLGGGPGVCSDTVVVAGASGGLKVSLRGYAGCSRADVLFMSDQRPAMALLMAAALWAMAVAAFGRRGRRVAVAGLSYGGLTLAADGGLFFDSAGSPVRLTPMQHRLMLMFFEAEGHCLSQQQICGELWPKKPDASATLYALIKRLRPVLESCSRLRIETYRGQAYRLTDR